MSIDTLETLCEALKLHTLRKQLPYFLEQMARQSKRPDEWLYDVLLQEWEERKNRRTLTRIKAARFPLLKTLERFDFTKSESINPAQIKKLGGGDYLQQVESIIFIGEPGTGKTH